LNKYIIYEPSSYYKNDISIANTKLNMYFNSGNGDNFYHILNNNASINYNINDDLNRNTIINSVRTLSSMSNFNIDNIKLITNNIDQYNKLNKQNKLEKNNELDSVIYYNFNIVTGTLQSSSDIKNPIQFLFSEINQIIIYKNNQIDNFKIITNLNLNFSSKSYQIMLNLSNYYAYLYYKLNFYKSLILKYLNNNINKIKRTEYSNLYHSLEKTIFLLEPYKTKIIIYTSITSNKTKIDENNKRYIFDNNIILLKINEIVASISTTIVDSDYDTILNNIITILFNYDNTRIYINFKKDIDDNSASSIKIKINNVDIDIYLSIDTTSIITQNQSKIIQPSITISSIHYYEFPNKITDNHNNDIILKISNLLENNVKYYINDKISDEDLNNNTYKLKSNFKDDTNIKQLKLNKTKTNIYSSSKSGNSDYICDSSLYLPTKIYKHNTDDYRLLFKKIILNVLYNNLINITTQFDNNDLKNLFSPSSIDNTQINFYDFSSFFTKPNVVPSSSYDLKDLNSFIIGITSTTTISDSSPNVLGFIILLYNIYNYNINSNKIISIIEYFIYIQSSNPILTSTNIFNDVSPLFNNNDLVKDLNSIPSKTIKPKNEKDYIRNNYFNVDLIRHYEKNKHLVSLILNIYSNIFTNVKSVISSIDKTNLCFSSNDKYAIEQNLYNHISKYYTLGTSLPLRSVNIKPAFFNKESKQKLLDINQEIINVFKIIDFLFENVSSDSNNNTLSKEQDEIIKNYNFYNPELYNNIKNFTQEELFINCNYVNKYNNLETSKLELFKYNCDNVAYNFPILLIIFVVVFGEAYLIKY